MNESQISQAGKPSEESLSHPPNPSSRILVVERDDNVRRFSTELLIQFGYQVDAAADAAAAWEILRTQNYHLVITDNDMPKVTGVDLLKKLHGACMALPVIMVARALPKEDFTQCPWLLPAALLLEPYQPCELVVTVQEVLRVTDGAPPPPNR
jgi:DNA-binding response OmpR family regulator